MNKTEHNNRLSYLLQQYAVKNTGAEEEEELYLLIEECDDETLKHTLLPILESSESLADFDSDRWQPMLERVLSEKVSGDEIVSPSTLRSRNEFPKESGQVRTGKAQGSQDESLVVSMKPRTQLWKKFAVAASIVGLLFVGYWLFRPSTSLRTTDGPSTVAQDVKAPDKNRAQIKLADGSIVYLDSAANGNLASMQGVTVVKTADGKIEYRESGMVSSELKYNTLMNPRGSQVMHMTLSDGSRVWLNAGSSVTYPVAFVGRERKVNITGEAYFEISHDKSKPFIVSANNKTDVTVLGTHFNVNAYDDESDIKVTLLEGSVNVSRESSVVRLKPGQQAQVSNDIKLVNGIDLGQIMAWKNGKFEFGDAANVEEIMRQIARWYDVEIEYKRKVSGQIGGSISRGVNVSQVLKMLALTDEVDFEIQGKKIIVK